MGSDPPYIRAERQALGLPSVSQHCTIAVEGADLPTREFDRLCARRSLLPSAVERSLHPRPFPRTDRNTATPVVMRNATFVSSAEYRARTTVRALIAAVGDANVTLSSSNSFSYGRRRMSVAQYLTEALSPQAQAAWAAAARDDSAAAEMYYWFGEHGEELKALTSSYPLPRYATPGALLSVAMDAQVGATESARPIEAPALSFGVGPDGSGVPFHFHGDGFSEVFHGAKLWLLYPHKPPRFRENATAVRWLYHPFTSSPSALHLRTSSLISTVPPLQVRWLYSDYYALTPAERPLECLIGPGDLLYFPKGWWHAVVNVGETVFMSTFL